MGKATKRFRQPPGGVFTRRVVRKVEVIENYCRNCSTWFIARTPTALYCSRRCTSHASVRRLRARRAAKRLHAVVGQHGLLEPVDR